MAINDHLEEEVDDFFEGDYDITAAEDIPALEEVGLGNEGHEIELAMLFVDIHESTAIVDGFRRQTAAKMYKRFFEQLRDT